MPAAAPDLAPSSARIFAYDNAKFLLATLVVVGHFIGVFLFNHAPADSRFGPGLFTFIYSFHMPLFILISGLFLRPFEPAAPLPLRRIAMLFILGFALKIVRTIFVFVGKGGHTSFKLLEDNSTPWFLFALGIFIFLAWALREFNKLPVLVFALGLALAVGYDRSVGDFLYLSRIIVFFPFFWIGYCFQAKQMREFLLRPWVRAAAALVVAVFAAACALWTFEVLPLRYLFQARLPYASIPTIAGAGLLHRSLAYVIQFAMSFAVLALTPNARIPVVTSFGARSLQIYFWHFVVQMILVEVGFFPWLAEVTPLWIFAVPLMAVVTAFFIGLRPWGMPLEWLVRPVSGSAKKASK